MERNERYSRPVVNFELVEVPVTVNGLTRVAFPDQPQLKTLPGQKIFITGIDLITDNVLAKAPISGNTTAPIAELLKASLVLYVDGWEKEHLIPLLFLNSMHDSDSTAATTINFANNPTEFDSLKNVDWTKSYISFNGTTATATYSVLLGVRYRRTDDNGTPY